MKHIYKRCRAQLDSDKKVMIEQKELIKKLDKKIGKDKTTHRTEGFLASSALWLLVLLLL